MRTPLVLTAWLALVASGCVSAFPPSSLDYGRGPEPLEPGTLRIQAGGGGGVAPLFFAGGGALGARGEVQVSEHIAVGIDAGAGLQMQPVLFTAPFGGHVSTQVNPGLDWLALRGAVGVGGDAITFAGLPLPGVVPWVSGAGSLVLGVPEALVTLGPLDPYLSLSLGFRRYAGADFILGVPSSPVAQNVLYDAVYAGGLTLGAAWYATDVLSFYGAANGTLLLMGYGMSSVGPALAISPALSLQAGVAFAF